MNTTFHLPRGYEVRLQGGSRRAFVARPARRTIVVSISTDSSGDGDKELVVPADLVIDYVTAYDSGADLSAWRLHWENARADAPDFLPTNRDDGVIYPRANQLLTTAADLYKQVAWNTVVLQNQRRKWVVSGSLASGTVELTLHVRELAEVTAAQPDYVHVESIDAENQAA